MAVEAKRGCGYRKVGGLYLVSGGAGISCHRLPMNIHVCPVCSNGIKYSRGFTWLNPNKFFGTCETREWKSSDEKLSCHQTPACPVCYPPDGKHGLMWIGKKFYSASEFSREAAELGISKRISTIPRDFKLGETWIYLAHLEAGTAEPEEDEGVLFELSKKVPAVFYCFKPIRIEMIITETDSRNEEKMKLLEKRGVTPVIVPDDDKDHQGTVHDKDEE